MILGPYTSRVPDVDVQRTTATAGRRGPVDVACGIGDDQRRVTDPVTRAPLSSTVLVMAGGERGAASQGKDSEQD